MKRFAATVLASVLVLIVYGSNTRSLAQDFVTGFVSSQGSDANACVFAVPSDPNSQSIFATLASCRNFSRALETVGDGGSIACIDAGAFGLASITKSVTIDCRAGGGGSNAAGFGISAPGKHVRLRNLTLNAGGVFQYALVIHAAASVELDNVMVKGATDTAIYDRRAGPAKLSIRNSTILGPANNSSAASGIILKPQGGTITAVLDNVIVRNANYGIAVGRGGRVMITRSVFAHNRTAGIEADLGAIVEINDTLVSNNTTGVVASAGSTIALSKSGINSNNTGISGSTISFGNNRLFANAVSDGTPPTPAGATSSENGLK